MIRGNNLFVRVGREGVNAMPGFRSGPLNFSRARSPQVSPLHDLPPQPKEAIKDCTPFFLLRGARFIELCKDHQWEKVKQILSEQPALVNCDAQTAQSEKVRAWMDETETSTAGGRVFLRHTSNRFLHDLQVQLLTKLNLKKTGWHICTQI